ncbi:MAG: hypothetical protein CFH34_01699 [Alphaproteobacteria bacterium MarineAlpha9_Bin4]|nr:hypothetical protein [Pelagibacterales bacterium]PPR24762.1 MAG: hypothetical protein CFH34_01699 [Alphaproteobacteria bacterium MarineAlpha9_Bin4]|tara:strand:- start:1641 stop:2213 length:573 start_codon:yes stop_codon:yes gene_type:complete
MKLKYNILKLVAISFGIFTFIWMINDYFSSKPDINKNYLKANEAFLDKKYNEAFKYYNRALIDNPKNIYFLDGKARALFRLGNYYEAEKIFKEAIEEDKTFVAAIANLGILYDTLGKHKEAIKYYKLAVQKQTKVTQGMSWFKRFLKNIHFKPSSIEDRLIFLENRINTKSNNLKLIDREVDKKQPDFEM